MVDKSQKAQDLRHDPHERHVELDLGGRVAACFAKALKTTRSALTLFAKGGIRFFEDDGSLHAEGARWRMNEFPALRVRF
jgi:hypothetical protein